MLRDNKHYLVEHNAPYVYVSSGDLQEAGYTLHEADMSGAICPVNFLSLICEHFIETKT